jgi:hypothetical protein
MKKGSWNGHGKSMERTWNGHGTGHVISVSVPCPSVSIRVHPCPFHVQKGHGSFSSMTPRTWKSMEWTQNGHGTDMGRIWNGYGTDMERIWNGYGTDMEYGFFRPVLAQKLFSLPQNGKIMDFVKIIIWIETALVA